MLTNLAKSLVIHKRITTTVPKAKALRKFVEPIFTKSKNDTNHTRKMIFSFFQDKVPVKELFHEISSKIAERPGGYTRIIRLGNRLGDNAEICMIELVDYNKCFVKTSTLKKTRRGKRKTKAPEAATVQNVDLTNVTKEKAYTQSVKARHNDQDKASPTKKLDQKKLQKDQNLSTHSNTDQTGSKK